MDVCPTLHLTEMSEVVTFVPMLSQSLKAVLIEVTSAALFCLNKTCFSIHEMSVSRKEKNVFNSAASLCIVF